MSIRLNLIIGSRQVHLGLTEIRRIDVIFSSDANKRDQRIAPKGLRFSKQERTENNGRRM